MSTDPRRTRRSSGTPVPLWALGLILLLGIVLLIASSIWLFQTVQTIAARPNLADPQFGAVDEQQPGAPDISVQPGANPQEGSTDNSVVDLPAWSGSERVNILMMGVDQRCDEEGPTHSDTIMIASIDPLAKRVALMSIPRDLWVDIPGFGPDRINTAYFKGQAYEYPGGGAKLAAETVEAFLGIPIDYYLTVDFQAFVDVVDLIGGITVDVPETIDDPTYPDNCYGYDPFTIQPGRHLLDGATALKYARTRATLGGDVDRAARQQQVILAVKDQVSQLNNLPQLLLSVPQLWQSLQDNVDTNLKLEQILQLGRLGLDIPRENVTNTVLGYDYVYPETTPDGQQVLVPIYDKIRVLRDEVFAASPVPTPVIEALPENMELEDARVAVYNGTAEFGLAATTQEYLQRLGVNVTEIGNADSSTYASTQIIDYGSHPNTVQFLIREMAIPPLNVSSGSDPAGDYDMLVILGGDWQVP